MAGSSNPRVGRPEEVDSPLGTRSAEWVFDEIHKRSKVAYLENQIGQI